MSNGRSNPKNLAIYEQILTAHARGCKDIVEIGTGTSTIIFLAHMHPQGRLWTIDTKPDKHKGFVTSHDSRLHPITSSSHQVAWQQVVDLCYIDGDHHLRAVKDDLDIYGPWVRPSGWILLDDIHGESEAEQIQLMLSSWCEARGLTWGWCAGQKQKLAHILVTGSLTPWRITWGS